MAMEEGNFNGNDYEMLQQLDDGITQRRGASDESINRLPVRVVSNEQPNSNTDGNITISSINKNNIIETNICSICLGNFEAGDEVRLLLCQHEFHKQCIDQWLRSNAICPTCKNQATDI